MCVFKMSSKPEDPPPQPGKYEGGRGGGGLGPKSVGTKMARLDFPNDTFCFFPRWSLWSGGGGGFRGATPLPLLRWLSAILILPCPPPLPPTRKAQPPHTPARARAYTQDDGIFHPPALRWGLVAVDSPLGLGTGQSGSSASWWGREGRPHPRACSCMRPPAQPNPTLPPTRKWHNACTCYAPPMGDTR